MGIKICKIIYWIEYEEDKADKKYGFGRGFTTNVLMEERVWCLIGGGGLEMFIKGGLDKEGSEKKYSVVVTIKEIMSLHLEVLICKQPKLWTIKKVKVGLMSKLVGV